jgi:hypothetical protein
MKRALEDLQHHRVLKKTLEGNRTLFSLNIQNPAVQKIIRIFEMLESAERQEAANKYDEVFLRLSTGVILASFSDNANGLNTRFSVLTAGSYQTTDATGCRFNVNASNVVTW